MPDPTPVSSTIQLPPPRGAPSSLRESAAELVSCLAAEAEAADARGAVTPAAHNALIDSRLLIAPFPAAFGGAGLGTGDKHRDLVAILRMIGAADLSMARLYEGHVNAVLLVARYGTLGQIRALAASVRDGALAGVWGAEGPRPLSAIRGDEGWHLSGGKILASGAGLVTRPLVPVSTEGGPVLMLVPLEEAGRRVDLSGWTAQGMRSSATGSVDFTGLAVSDDQVIGSTGDFMRQPFFSGGAWRFCAVHLGAAERLVDLFRAHLRERGRDGDPYQLQRIATSTAAVTTARFWVEEAARRLAEDENEPQDIVAFTNLTRMVTERAALDVLEATHRGVGLGGFIRPHPIERISRDLSTYLRQPVPDLAMADAGRAVLASPRSTGRLWETEA